ETEMFKDNSLIEKIEVNDNARQMAWYKLLRQVDEGYKNPKNYWYNENLNDSNWATMKVPGYWADTELGFVNGVVWFRKKINIPSSMVDKPSKLILGRIVDADSAFINGEFVGTIGYQYPPSRFDIPSGLLKEGENTIVVRIINNSGTGGFVLDKQYAIINEDTSINLDGDWKYKLGAEMPEMVSQTFIRWKPIGLYNSMIAPLHNYKIKGAIWYQGENNVFEHEMYRNIFETMISNWRDEWCQGDFPFYYVQLAPYNYSKPLVGAALRDAQRESLEIKNVGMAVTLDIGNPEDIHPKNKFDVGKRLSLWALAKTYGKGNIVFSGPIYKSMKIEGDKIRISFDYVGSGLMSKGDTLTDFTIAGKNQQFYPAEAVIDGNTILVSSNDVKNPVAVRFAFANADEPNLFNKEGLPASTFRTDNWEIITEDKD
ncbi:MAG: beta galactosidase jelly roll domain-containing protein, partial [Ignavibacteriae bacterium]|nr:beta galactosidase jelly roll domain-containing protein [Ignavibacteriota bacterium]